MAPKAGSLKRAFAAAFQQIRNYSAPGDRSIPPAKQKYVPTSGTYPKGFLAGSAHAGVKASNTKYDDMTLIASENPCSAAAVFTRNIFKAAPVQVSKQMLNERRMQGIRAVVVNSGCANAVTGKAGLEDAMLMARMTDAQFSGSSSSSTEDPPQTLVMSTGVIGQRLPIQKITDAIPKLHANLGNTHEHWLGAAQAICTTDTFPKLISRTFTLPSHPGTTYSIAGMTKGAGMIHPNMATLLGIIATDVAIAPQNIRQVLTVCTSRSFNCISIDGDTSTNDTVALLANGAAKPEGVPPVQSTLTPDGKHLPPKHKSEDHKAFEEILTEFMTDLAKLVVRDGEGATKFVTIRVQSVISYHTAKRAATSIATSSLVKTALYGKDANWGRILCAIGYAPGIMASPELPTTASFKARLGARPTPKQWSEERQVNPETTSVSFIPADGSEELKLLVRGEPEQVDETRAKEILEMEDLEILVKLDDVGDSGSTGRKEERKMKEALFWTCDFSHEYVTINGDYRT